MYALTIGNYFYHTKTAFMVQRDRDAFDLIVVDFPSGSVPGLGNSVGFREWAGLQSDSVTRPGLSRELKSHGIRLPCAG